MGEKEIKYKINWNTLDNINDFMVDYNQDDDILLMQSKKERPSISIDCDGEFWCRIDPKTGEILGIEIEDFQRIYLRNHPELLSALATNIRPIADSIRVVCSPA